MADFATDVSDTAFDFQRVVWPAVLDRIGGGELIHIESETAKGLTQKLDMHAGIDAWHIMQNDSIVRGVASRIQWGPTNWRTFTIRKSRDSGASTEFAKRLSAINGSRGAIYPHITVQAYITHRRIGDLLGAAVVRTRDLFLLADNLDKHCKPDGKLWGYRRTSNATFIWIAWDCLSINKVPVKIIMPEKVAA